MRCPDLRGPAAAFNPGIFGTFSSDQFESQFGGQAAVPVTLLSSPPITSFPFPPVTELCSTSWKF